MGWARCTPVPCARAGLVALVYDHRNLGAAAASRAARSTVGAVPRLPRCPRLRGAARGDRHRPHRLWGDSYTGGQVVAVARVRPTASRRRRAVPGLRCSAAHIATRRRLPCGVQADPAGNGNVAATPETTTGAACRVLRPGRRSVAAGADPGLPLVIDYGGRPGSGWFNRASAASSAANAGALRRRSFARPSSGAVLLMVAPGGRDGARQRGGHAPCLRTIERTEALGRHRRRPLRAALPPGRALSTRQPAFKPRSSSSSCCLDARCTRRYIQAPDPTSRPISTWTP